MDVTVLERNLELLEEIYTLIEDGEDRRMKHFTRGSTGFYGIRVEPTTKEEQYFLCYDHTRLIYDKEKLRDFLTLHYKCMLCVDDLYDHLPKAEDALNHQWIEILPERASVHLQWGEFTSFKISYNAPEWIEFPDGSEGWERPRDLATPTFHVEVRGWLSEVDFLKPYFHRYLPPGPSWTHEIPSPESSFKVFDEWNVQGFLTGGYVRGPGLDLHWQDGHFNGERPRNGVLPVDMLNILIHRLSEHQKQLPSPETEECIQHLNAALDALNRRHRDRIKRGVYATYDK